MKKGVTIATLVSLGLCGVILILSIFGVFEFSGIVFKLLLTFATIVAAGSITLNPLTLVQAKNKWGYVSIALILTSSILVLLMIWIDAIREISVLFKLTGTISILSIIASIIISNAVKLGKKLLAVQIVSYVIICATFTMIALIIWGIDIFDINLMTEFFWVFVVLTVGCFITISVLSNKYKTITPKDQTLPTPPSPTMVTITRKEYDELLNYKEKFLAQQKEENKN